MLETLIKILVETHGFQPETAKQLVYKLFANTKIDTKNCSIEDVRAVASEYLQTTLFDLCSEESA